MEKQSYKNHSKMVPGFHYLGGSIMLLLLIGAIVNLVQSNSENRYTAILLVLVPILFVISNYYTRAFSLKAQDRAIRAEENFRHYILTGKPFSNDLKTRQIIGLRFASDEEFPELVKRAISESLSEKDIKKFIKNWKSDNYRV